MGSQASLSSLTHYEHVKTRYRDPKIAGAYESARFHTAKGRKRNHLMLAAIKRALDKAACRGIPVRQCLDLPCGTGRLFPLLWQERPQFVGADISWEMMQVARTKSGSEADGATPVALVQCDSEHIPFRDRAFDGVFSIRFMCHLPPAVRVRILREMGRVSRRWLIVDVRHRYNFRWLFWQVCNRLGLRRRVDDRCSRQSLRREVTAAGLRVVGIFSPRRGCSLFSDKWVVLLEKAGGAEP